MDELNTIFYSSKAVSALGRGLHTGKYTKAIDLNRYAALFKSILRMANEGIAFHEMPIH